jgi:hypothetical protein
MIRRINHEDGSFPRADPTPHAHARGRIEPERGRVNRTVDDTTS